MKEKSPIACVPRPQSASAIPPPPAEPASPIAIVSQIGIGSGPGTASRASPPVKKPNTMIDRTATSIPGKSTFGLAATTGIAHTQATLRSSIILGAAMLLLAGGASAPAATGIGQVVGNDAPSWSPDGQSIVF